MSDLMIMGLPNHNNPEDSVLQAAGITLPSKQEHAVLPFQPSDSSDSVQGSDKTAPGRECQTCKNRKYQDGSDEMVSFKSAQHISPAASASRVMAHEMEHVSNAYAKAAVKDGEVLQCSVSLKTAVCPECGRVYIAGGETRTSIRYSEKSPYQDALSEGAESFMKGKQLDLMR